MKMDLRTIAWFLVANLAATVQAQQSTTYENGPDGVTYRVTQNTVQRSIPTTEIQTREQKVFHPQVRTEYQSYQQTYLTPVTEYQWTPRLQGRWNPFVAPYWSHQLTPTTRWEARPTTVQVPVARTEWLEETRTTQIPVTTYRTVPETYTSRVAVSASPAGATAVANRPIGSQQLQSDPPREPSPWSGSSDYRR
jgi:hypothetical protein